MWHQAEEQPRETKFFYPQLGANKARDENTADGVKALGLEIAIHSFITVQQKARIPVSIFPCLSVFLAPCLQREGYRSYVDNLQLPRRTVVWLHVERAVICVRPDSSVTDRHKAPKTSFSVICIQTLTNWHPFLIMWLCHGLLFANTCLTAILCFFCFGSAKWNCSKTCAESSKRAKT